MGVIGNMQSFILATIAFLGFFAYIVAVTMTRQTPDPIVFPVLVSIVTAASSFYFSGHIANGAAGKALDALIQTNKDRETAIATARAEQPPRGDERT